VLDDIISLNVENGDVVFSEKTENQLNRLACRIRHKIFMKLMVICAGSNSLEELENLVDQHLEKLSSKGMYYLWDRLCWYVEKLHTLQQFDSMKEVINKNRKK